MPATPSTTPSPASALAATTAPVVSLDDATLAAMWRLFDATYCDVSEATFRRDLAGKEHVILLRDRRGALKGFSAVTSFATRVAGRPVVIVYSGDTVIDPEHWGHSALQRAFLRYIVACKVRHPFTTVYWYLITKGFKTYLLLARNFPVHWPRHDRPTPPWERSLLDHLARARFGERWDPARGVLGTAPGTGRLRTEVAPVTEALAAGDPAVAFFARANPGHAAGEELCCLGLVDPAQWGYYLGRLGLKLLRRRLAGWRPRRDGAR
jgi:hypothetical protein